MTDDRRRGFVTATEDGERLATPARGSLTFLATGEETGGAVSAFESRIEPGEGPPLHLHAREDELIYVADGHLRVRLGDAMREAPTGALLFIPRGVPHAWLNVGAGTARFFGLFTPAAPGMERFFERASELPGDQRLKDSFADFAEEAGMVVLGPPLGGG